MRRLSRNVAILLIVAAVALTALEAWAHTNLETSPVARAIVWLDADVDDYNRFPFRRIDAGPTVLQLDHADRPATFIERVAGPASGEIDRVTLLERTESTAFIVLHGKRVVVEEYYNGSSRDAIQTSFSVAKSFMSTLFGIALEEGFIGGLDEPITTYLPELRARDQRFSRITIRHLMTMASGLRYEEQGLPWSDDATTYYAPDLRAAALSVEIDGEPGTRWMYNNYNLLLAGMILERATGQPISEFMERELWQPMGAEFDASWSLDSNQHGFEKSESGINARAIDFARFGALFLHDGRAGSVRIVSPRWVKEATARDVSRDPAEHYQYWWWVDTERAGRFYAVGNKGQYIYVAPDRDLVIVRMGRDYGIDQHEWPLILRDVADRFPAHG